MDCESNDYSYSSLNPSIHNSEVNEGNDMEKAQETLRTKCSHLLVPMECLNLLDEFINEDQGEQKYFCWKWGPNFIWLNWANNSEQMINAQYDIMKNSLIEHMDSNYNPPEESKESRVEEELKEDIEKCMINRQNLEIEEIEIVDGTFNSMKDLIKNRNDKSFSPEITKPEIQSVLEDHAWSLNVNTRRLVGRRKNDIFNKSFVNKWAKIPFIMRNSFYKENQWGKSWMLAFILFSLKLFFECFVLFYDISLPTELDPNSKQAIDLLCLFLDFLILTFSKKKVKKVILLFSKLDSGKSICMSNRLEQLDILECKDKQQIRQLYNKNHALQHILNNYKSVFQRHPQFDKIAELVDKSFKDLIFH